MYYYIAVIIFLSHSRYALFVCFTVKGSEHLLYLLFTLGSIVPERRAFVIYLMSIELLITGQFCTRCLPRTVYLSRSLLYALNQVGCAFHSVVHEYIFTIIDLTCLLSLLMMIKLVILAMKIIYRLLYSIAVLVYAHVDLFYLFGAMFLYISSTQLLIFVIRLDE